MRCEPLPLIVLLAGIAAVPACEPHPDPTPTPMSAPIGTPAPAEMIAPAEPGQADREAMRPHLEPMTEAADSLRVHAATVRALPEERQGERVLRDASRVIAAIEEIEQRFVTLTLGREVHDPVALRLLGSTAESYRGLLSDMAVARGEAETLLGAAPADAADALPAYLDRLDRILIRVDHTLAHMRNALAAQR